MWSARRVGLALDVRWDVSVHDFEDGGHDVEGGGESVVRAGWDVGDVYEQGDVY